MFVFKEPSDDCHWNLPMISPIGLGNGLVPSGNKPLPESVLTDLYCHVASLDYNKLDNRHNVNGDLTKLGLFP